MNKKLEVKAIKKTILWAAQQGYTNANAAAKEIKKLTGEEMIEDQAYYNTYKFIKKI
jgi:hypothetical protein